MKAYTNLTQSKKLAEILPLESADMHYSKDFDGSWFADLAEYTSVKMPKYVDKVEEHLLPCWGLTALLGVLPVSCDDGQHCLALINSNPNEKTEWLCAYEDCKGDLILECYGDNPVDACYEMILKLHELKML